MEVLRKKLSDEEGSITGVTYDPVTDEVLYNGEVNENFDPRVNPAYLMDAGSNEVCGAAEGMRVEIAKWVLGAVGATSVVGLANISLTAALFLIPVGWMFGAFWAVANAALLIGSVTIGSAFTPAVLEEIRCILLTCLEPNGTITAAGLQQARAGVDQQIGDPVVTACFDLMIQSWGHVGFSNAGIVNYDPIIDCTCEACPLNYSDTMIGHLGWRGEMFNLAPNVTQLVTSGGHNGATSYQVTSTFQAASGWQVGVRYDLGQDCYMQSYAFWARWSGSGGFRACLFRLYNEAGTLVFSTSHTMGTGSAWQQAYRLIGVGVGRYVDIILQANSPAGQPYLSGTVEFHGT